MNSEFFELPATEVEYCRNNPMKWCLNPWLGAHGRAAEQPLKVWGEHLTGRTFINVPALYDSITSLPSDVTQIINGASHIDGTRHYNTACDGGFLGDPIFITEVKFDTYDPQFSPKLTFKQAKLRISLLENELPFILILGELREEVKGEKSGTGEGIAVIDLNRYLHVVNDKQILVSRIKELITLNKTRLLI